MKILITGVSTRAMAESAVGSGYPVVALDAFADLDLQAMCDAYSLWRDFHIHFSAAGLYRASQHLEFDRVVYTSSLENHPGVMNRFARRCPVIGNSADTLARIRNWPALFGRLAEAGFHVPETLFAGSRRKPDPSRLWLRKPVHSGGGHGVAFSEDGRGASKRFMLQEYLPGTVCSASFVADGDTAVVIGLTEQLVGRPEFGASGFRYCGSLLPLQAALEPTAPPTIKPAIQEQVQQIANLLTREFHLVGVNGMDFILHHDQVWLLEVNPRYSASMELIEQAYGLPVFDWHVRAATRGELPESDPRASSWRTGQQFYGKAILFAGQNSQAPDTRLWLARGLRDIPMPGEDLLQGHPVCTILENGASREACLTQLAASAQALTGEIYARHESRKEYRQEAHFNHRPVNQTRERNLDR